MLIVSLRYNAIFPKPDISGQRIRLNSSNTFIGLIPESEDSNDANKSTSSKPELIPSPVGGRTEWAASPKIKLINYILIMNY